jgi:hypothetical protein
VYRAPFAGELTVADGGGGDADMLVLVTALLTTVEVMPVPQPLSDAWFAASPL